MNRLLILLISLAVMGAALAAAPAVPAPPTSSDVAAAVREAARYTIEGPRDGLTRLEAIIHRSRPGDNVRHQIELQLAAALSGDATSEAKRFFCRYLGIIGSAASVPALERLLQDPETAHLACYALLTHPTSAADVALRRALDRAGGTARICIINTLGDRRDTRAITPLGRLAVSSDAMTAEAALAAIGRIGGFTATDTLERIRRKAAEPTRSEAARALIQCAQQFADEGEAAKAAALFQRLYQDPGPMLLRRSALIGLVRNSPPSAASDLVAKLMQEPDVHFRATAIAQIPVLKDPATTRRFSGYLAKAVPEVQLLLLEALTDRADPVARPAIERLLRDPNPAVALASIQAVARFAEAASTPALLQAAAAPSSREHLDAILGALRQLSGSTVNDAVAKAMPTAPATLRPLLIELLSDRRATAAVPVILESASSRDPAVAKAAFRALASLAGAAQLQPMLARLTSLQDESLAADAELAVVRIASQIPNPDTRTRAILGAYAKADRLPARLSLLRVLGGLGGAQALETMLAAGQDAEPTLRDAANRLLAAWPDPSAVKSLLKLAGDSADPTLRVLFLRGALRLLGESETLPSSERLTSFRAAMALASQPEEKRLALASLSETPFAGALDLVMPMIGDSKVNAEACLAALRIARSQLNTQKEAARAALEKVAAAAPDATLRDQAAALLKQGS